MGYLKKPLQYFLRELSSSAMSPGGGSAAALTAALGVGLIEMVSRIDEKRARKKGSSSETSKRHVQACQRIRGDLSRLITKDVEVFLKLNAVPKDNRGSAVYQKALKASAEVPYDICRLCCQAINYAGVEKKSVSKWLYSDLIESTILLDAAYRSAILNVNCNLNNIKDLKYAKKMKNHLSVIQKKMLKISREIRKEAKA